jgi:signal transduction histidine kinase
MTGAGLVPYVRLMRHWGHDAVRRRWNGARQRLPAPWAALCGPQGPLRDRPDPTAERPGTAGERSGPVRDRPDPVGEPVRDQPDAVGERLGPVLARLGPAAGGRWPAGPRPGPPWQRARRGRHVDWPPGAAIVASIFHIAGTRDLSAEGGLHVALTPAVYALLLIGPAALLWRRRAPVLSLAVAAVASLAVAAHADPHWMYAVAPALALFALAKQGRHVTAGIAAIIGWATYLLVTVGLHGFLGLPAGARPGPREALLAGVGLLGSVLFGAISKVHHDQVTVLALAREEQQRAVEEQKRAEGEQKRRQASEERLRMAQELHDVLGHHLSLISVQAGVGLHLMDNRPEQAREALSAIKTASAEALREVRSVLGVLRTEGEAAPRQPALGLSRLTDLTADAGFPVHTRIGGEPRALPAEVDRAAYRIVQEALTNVRRHAGPGPAVLIEIDYRGDALFLSIGNTGPAGDDPVAGRLQQGSGITGMRARAEGLGGRLTAGPEPGGGFRVTAVLPSPPVPGAAPPPPAETSPGGSPPGAALREERSPGESPSGAALREERPSAESSGARSPVERHPGAGLRERPSSGEPSSGVRPSAGRHPGVALREGPSSEESSPGVRPPEESSPGSALPGSALREEQAVASPPGETLSESRPPGEPVSRAGPAEQRARTKLPGDSLPEETLPDGAAGETLPGGAGAGEALLGGARVGEAMPVGTRPGGTRSAALEPVARQLEGGR